MQQFLQPDKERLNKFLSSPRYIVFLTAVCTVAHLLHLELVAYGCLTAMTVYVCLWGKDLLPLTPLFLFCYLLPSSGNNPGLNPQSVFSGFSGVLLGLMLCAILGSALWHVLRRPARFWRCKRRLLPGMLVLFGAYLLSGIGSAGYSANVGRNLLFALLQGLSVLLPYWLLSGGIDWEDAPKDYFAWIGFCAGGFLTVQLIACYMTGGVIVDGIIHRTRIYSGWGMYNNLGAMLAMMIPFAFYLATKYRRGWIGTVVGSAFLIGVVMSCSRTAFLIGTCIYVVCIILMLYYARNRQHNTVALILTMSLAAVILIFFHRQLLQLFSEVLSKRLDPSSRDVIFQEGLKLFSQAPVFGNSFFSPGYLPWDFATVEQFSAFFPPRWHNTFVQLLASCGIVGLGAYLFHRVQTVKLFLCRRGKEGNFIGCCIAVLLLCSLMDCHFFNVGPALFYSAALAFLEFYPHRN